eukprot:NODE_4178_length_1925_cov_13.773637.p1 GENE.NODE_4178_length_1925_cov_13.773637~~NODE_4178_length_1925_cov_13.773637.p1  ORF type:complete len:585 (-),score=68.54 NODE_4178_length_1925_cov_13.773637:171-1739(-)
MRMSEFSRIPVTRATHKSYMFSMMPTFTMKGFRSTACAVHACKHEPDAAAGVAPVLRLRGSLTQSFPSNTASVGGVDGGSPGTPGGDAAAGDEAAALWAAAPIEEKPIVYVDTFVGDGLFGLDLPERVLREAYIMRPDLTFLMGWDTGRVSEPDFMNMNLHSLRDGVEPKVVLYQYDKTNPMNPHGLLVAYSEATVKPVVSDFDTFLVGSRRAEYEPLPPEQLELAEWSLDRTREILRDHQDVSWNRRWLTVLRLAKSQGLCPKIPKYGWGDATSCRMIAEVCEATKESGAVRHGAECFNFLFPQELDSSYLIVWEDFNATLQLAWQYMDEAGLRKFLMDRITEGFTFPLNPVWPVRDPGWYEIHNALKPTAKWMPERLVEKIDTIHQEHPAGFKMRSKIIDRCEMCEHNPNETHDLIMMHSNLWSDLRTALRVALDMPHLGEQLPRRFNLQHSPCDFGDVVDRAIADKHSAATSPFPLGHNREQSLPGGAEAARPPQQSRMSWPQFHPREFLSRGFRTRKR